MITYSEISDSGISSDDYAKITNAGGEFLKSVIIQRQNPDFTLHDEAAGRSTYPFSAAADGVKILRCYNDGANYYVDYLLAESDVQGSPSSWSSPTMLGASRPGLQPKVVKQNSRWEVICVDDTGAVQRYYSTSGTGSWSVSSFASTGIGTDPNTTVVAYGGVIETLYYWKYDSGTASWDLRYLLAGSGGDNTSQIYWHEAPGSMDCALYHDDGDDKHHDITNSDVRHALVCGLATPSLYVYKDVEGLPSKTEQHTGGLVSFIVRPHLSTMRTFAQFSTHHEVQLFDDYNVLQYRRSCHISTTDSVYDPGNDEDTFFVAAIGGDGDRNGADTSYSYDALYYYVSRNDKHWSQDRIVPIPSGAVYSDFAGGAQLVKLANYIYILSAQATLRSPICLDFGVTHPDWTFDASNYVLGWRSSFSDQRQTQIDFDNKDRVLSNTILGQFGTLAIITKFGKKISGTEYLFQTSLEEIDTIQAVRQRPTEKLTVIARDHYAWLSEKTQAVNAVEYDTQMSGLDDFRELNNVADSGLSHTAVTKGTWGSDDRALKLVSRYSEGVAFNTGFGKSTIDNGFIETTFTLPKPGVHDTPVIVSPTNGSQPTYAGIVFRAIDQDNFWWVRYDYYAERIIVGRRLSGADVFFDTIDPGSYFSTQANSEMPVTIRVEFKYNFIRVFTTHASDTSLDFLFQYTLPGRTSTDLSMMDGSVGYIACGFSDEDAGADEPLPVAAFDPTATPGGDDAGYASVADAPPLDPLAPGKVAYFNGQEIVAWSSTDHVYLLNKFVTLSTPSHTDITPASIGSQNVVQCVIDPMATDAAIGCYLLTYDSSADQSYVWYSSDIATTAFVQGAAMQGKGSMMRATDVAGEVLVRRESIKSTVTEQAYDFTTGQHGWDTSSGSYVPGVGFQTANVGSAVDSRVYNTMLDPYTYLGAGITGYDVHWTPAAPGTIVPNYNHSYSIFQFRNGHGWLSFVDVTSGMSSASLHGASSGLYLGSGVVQQLVMTNPGAYTVTITYIKVYFDGPATVVDNTAAVVPVTAYGATVGTNQDVGSLGSTGGFDVQKTGTVSYCVSDFSLSKATTLGGAYTGWKTFTVTPVCAIIPYYRRNSNTVSNLGVINPDVIVALPAIDADGGTLYWIDGATGTKHDITPVSGIIFDNPNCVTTHYGTRIAVFGSVSGVYKLYVSTDCGAHWTLVKTVTAPHFIRGRRLNASLTRPQLYYADNGPMYYSSYWDQYGSYVRNMPANIVGFDTIW